MGHLNSCVLYWNVFQLGGSAGGCCAFFTGMTVIWHQQCSDQSSQGTGDELPQFKVLFLGESLQG